MLVELVELVDLVATAQAPASAVVPAETVGTRASTKVVAVVEVPVVPPPTEAREVQAAVTARRVALFGALRVLVAPRTAVREAEAVRVSFSLRTRQILGSCPAVAAVAAARLGQGTPVVPVRVARFVSADGWHAETASPCRSWSARRSPVSWRSALEAGRWRWRLRRGCRLPGRILR